MRKTWVRIFVCVLSISFVGVSSVKSQNTSRNGAQQADQSSKADTTQIAEAIIVREETATGRAFDKAYRAQIKADLASRSPEELAAIEKRGSGLLPSTNVLRGTATDLASPNLLGSDSADLVFTPVAPCRIIDTRMIPNPGGTDMPIVPGTNRNFIASGGPYGFQGGATTTCNVPFPTATAVFVNFVAVNATGPGDLRVFPFGGTVPLASFLNYANEVPALNLANGIAMQICDAAVTSCGFDFTIQADVSTTDLVADIMGYYSVTTCQGGTVKALGNCFETATRTASDVFVASDTCKTAGGRLATGMELRSLRGGSPLTLDTTGEWVDSVYVNGTNFVAMIIADGGGFTSQSTTTLSPFRCVFRPLP